MLKEGMDAPDFKAKDQDGNIISLSDYKGKNVVLYFYPKDNTPGCTKEACNFRDDLDEFTDLNAVILGVSADSEASHKKFISKYELPFKLISDPDKKIIQKYGVWKEKNNFGIKALGIVRSTFVIDKNGKIKKIFDKVKVDGHNQEVKEVLKET
ncbi:MAG TPA: thioredoxin-dependent thiol peroxidase [Ignavibacteriaceae bacterium]|nr:thioredoxin-dependent thiol peroxidase [Ignavibacteriaceae bacterium]